MIDLLEEKPEEKEEVETQKSEADSSALEMLLDSELDGLSLDAERSWPMPLCLRKEISDSQIDSLLSKRCVVERTPYGISVLYENNV